VSLGILQNVLEIKLLCRFPFRFRTVFALFFSPLSLSPPFLCYMSMCLRRSVRACVCCNVFVVVCVCVCDVVCCVVLGWFSLVLLFFLFPFFSLVCFVGSALLVFEKRQQRREREETEKGESDQCLPFLVRCLMCSSFALSFARSFESTLTHIHTCHTLHTQYTLTHVHERERMVDTFHS